MFLTLNDTQGTEGRVIAPAFPKILVRKFKKKTLSVWVRHADEWQSTCPTSKEMKLMTSTSLYSKIHLIWQGLVPVEILFEVFRKFWNFLGKFIDQSNPITCVSNGLANFCNFFGKFIDQLNHFTCKSMEIHISIWVLFTISTTIFDQLSM